MGDTREQIIQVAGHLFLQKNYEGVSIQDITRAAGMTKGALYHHFSCKEQLFEEVAHSLVGNFHSDYLSLPSESLQGFFRGLVEHAKAREGRVQNAKLPDSTEFGINAHNLLWDAVRLLPGFRASMESYNAFEHAAWTAAIQAAIDRGEIRGGLDAGKLAKIFTSVPDGVGIASLFKGRQLPRHEEILDLWETLYQSIKP